MEEASRLPKPYVAEIETPQERKRTSNVRQFTVGETLLSNSDNNPAYTAP